MAASSSSDNGGTISEINVTPLVDVVLVLLIIMMVAAPALSAPRGIKTNRPKAAASEQLNPDATSITVSLKRKDQNQPGLDLYVDGFSVSSDNVLVRTLESKVAANPKVSTIGLDAATDVPYGMVIHYRDLIHSARMPNVTTINFVTDSIENKK